MKLEEATRLALQGKLVEGFEEEEKYDKEIDTVLKNFPADFERIDDDQCFKYKNIFVELRPETVTDVNDVPEMDFAVFETEEDMNTDYEQNIGVDYWDISNPEAYWNYVKSYCEAVLDRLNNKEVKTEADGVQDITWLLDEYDGDVDICTKEQLGSDYFYKKLCTSVNDAERFNYHSDYWGDEDTYQEENIALMEEVEPYVGKEVEVTFEDETKRFKILGIAIDKQYNSLSHTVILAEEVKELKESTSDHEITMTDKIADNLGINKNEITETDGIIKFNYNGKTYKAEPISSCQVRIFDEDGKEVSHSVVINKIKEEVFTEYGKDAFIYQLVGGDYAGTYTREEAEKLPILEPELSSDDSEIRNQGQLTHRKELDNQLQFKGYLGPMWNGTEDGKGVIRYETQQVYDMLSENKVEELKEVKTESKYFGIDIPDDELYGSESNTTAYWLLDSVAKYFEDYVKEVESKPEMYQGEPDKERLAKISEMISNASKELKKYWSEAE